MPKNELEWRFLRSWSQDELKERLAGLSRLSPNFDELHLKSYKKFDSEKIIDAVSFEQAKEKLRLYKFSDPKIVRAYFDPSTPLLGRRMLLEIKVMGFHFLCGTVISEVQDRTSANETLFGYRYDTLAGHVESGTEWFTLRRNHKTGKIIFRIHGQWRPGRLPTWWSKAGFHLLASRYQRAWQRTAFWRLGRKSKNGALLPAIAVGAIAGMRSMSAPALLAHDGRFKHERWLEVLSFLEMAVDKTAFVPNRIAPFPLFVRVVSGGISASMFSAEFERRPKRLMLAFVGATTAIASAFTTFHLRKLVAKKLGVRDNLLGLIEDAVVLGARTAVSRRTGLTPVRWSSGDPR